MNEYVFFCVKNLQGKKKMKTSTIKNVKTSTIVYICAVVLWTKPRGLGGCIHHFRDLGYVNYRKYKNVNYRLGFVLG